MKPLQMLIIGLIVLVDAPAIATVPQMPFAAGPRESVLQAVRKARQCGITRVRIERRSPFFHAPAAYYNQEFTPPQDLCVKHWMTMHGRKLKFKPRWYNDDFSEDPPK